MFSATSCNIKGCTDEDAMNYSEKARRDDGTCTYQASIVAWLTPIASDIYLSDNITELKFYLNQELIGILDPATHTSTGIPTCSGDEGLVMTVNLDPENLDKSYTLEWLDQDGINRGNASFELSPNECRRHQLF